VKIIGIIPVRYNSTRLPGKPLADIAGKPMLQHVWERASAARNLKRVIIATDDERILQKAKKFGAAAVLTSSSHRSGTERVAEAVKDLDVDIVVNIQGDEPLMKARVIDQAIDALANDSQVLTSTLAYKIDKEEDIRNSNVVKVVFDRDNFALYFSRAPIPFDRSQAPGSNTQAYKHLGLYVYRKDFLLKLSRMKPTPLERIESLEQLRILENGYRIKVVESPYDSIGVDTAEDLERAKAIIKGEDL
jgi:3-deoxy-manno-octulosonate cytidylyltransferase (CMP-KDO synthetase)